jgi:hypothetical protein
MFELVCFAQRVPVHLLCYKYQAPIVHFASYSPNA